MSNANSRVLRHSSAGGTIVAALSLIALILFDRAAFAMPQSGSPTGLLVTPSTTVLLVGENSVLSVVDENGHPASSARWSIHPSLAGLHEENGEVRIEAKQPGRAVLTATANNQTATAVITIVSGTELPPATVRWSLQPMAGFETLGVLQAVPSADGPVFYSIEWSKTSNAIVRAIGESGQQLWITQLTCTASPITLKHTLPPGGEVFQNQARLSDHSQFILGDKSSFAVNNATDPSYYNLPADGKSILLRVSGEDSGGLLLLERGRFRDSLLDLRPADGSEFWRFRSEGRLSKNWTVNHNGDVGIVETLANPASSALLILNAKTGQVRFRVPFPSSSTTVNGFRCTDPQRNILKNVRPSLSGSVFTSTDSNMYVQIETHVESLEIEACKNKQYSFDDSLTLLRVTPEGETEWKTFQHIHADGDGNFVVQPRVFAGESIPDGFGGVLAAWTYVFPGSKDGEKIRTEARVSRIGPSGQQDFMLPMPFWTKGLNSFFDQNMVLGEGNRLYATNGPLVLRFDTQAGVLNWVRHPPTGEVKIHHATAGGGLLVSNAGRLVYFDAQGNGQEIQWTVASTNPDDIGLVQTDLFDHTPVEPLQLRDVQLYWAGNFIAVEDGAPYGRGTLLYFTAQ